MHRHSNNRGTVSENIRELRGKTGNLEDALRESETELANVQEAIAYVNEAVGEGRADQLVDEIASAKYNIAQIALRLEPQVAKFQKLIDDSKRIAGPKYLRNASQPVAMQS